LSIGEINKKFGSLASADTDNLITKTRSLKEAWGDFKELLGEGLAPIFSKLIDYAKELVDALTYKVDKGAEE
jgi:hypothetical protein